MTIPQTLDSEVSCTCTIVSELLFFLTKLLFTPPINMGSRLSDLTEMAGTNIHF
jgi:hypothetical protein